MKHNNVLFGILAILLGLAVIAFPLISVFIVSDIVAIGLIFIGIWLLISKFISSNLEITASR